MMRARLPRARIDGLVIRELDDETLVYDTERDRAHCLNQTVALVWNRCNGKTTVGEMAGLLQEQSGARVDVDVVWLALKQLQQFQLLEKAALPVDLPSVSRRRMILKYAPAALALPLIMSISAPTPAGASSCVASGGLCGVGFPPCCPGLSCFGSPAKCGLG
jgi:hypothetical protein